MFLHGLLRADGGSRGSLLAGEVSRPLVFLITAWPASVDTFFLSDFPFCFHTTDVLFLCSELAFKVSLCRRPLCHTKGKQNTSLTCFTSASLADFLYFPESLDRCVFVICWHHPEKIWPMQSQCTTFRSLCGWLWRPLFGLVLRAPFSLLFCLALLCSAFLNTQGSFFVIVPADECLTVPSSGGFETGWTNDLSSFVLHLKGAGYNAYCQEKWFVWSTSSSYLCLLYQWGHFRTCLLVKLSA